MPGEARELLALRHAKSSWDSGAETDYDRPLAGRGKRDIPRVAAWIGSRGLVPDRIVSSGARRARQTARRIADELGIPRAEVILDDRAYECGPGDLLQVLAACPSHCTRPLLVGHNPGLELLVEHLAGAPIPTPAGCKAFPTGALALLRLPADWDDLPRGAGELVSLVRPRDLDGE